MTNPNLLKEINEMELPHYRNSTEIVPGKAVKDVVKACLIKRLNLFLLGESGEGKTQLENDVLALFGNDGFFELGRNDLTVKDIFVRLRLDKLREAKTSDEIREITEQTGHPVYVIDELTRCIPAVQNQFFNVGDGFFTDYGKKYPLGKHGYSILVASGNIGNGRYVGTSDTDRALLDRMHVVLDVDYAPKRSTDTLEILATKKDPRVSEGDGKNYTDTILRAHNELKNRTPTLLQYAAAMYLGHGLDYCEDLTGKSKRQNKQAWPGCVTGHDKGGDAALIFPFSTRGLITTLALAQGLEFVAEAKGQPYASGVEPVLDAAYIIGAQSGVLSPAAIDATFNSNPYAAMRAVVEGIRGEFAAKSDLLQQSIHAAAQGNTNGLDQYTGRWAFMRDVLTDAANNARERI